MGECKKKHKESGGKGDGKGDHEEVCVEEMKACASDKTCSMLREKMQAAKKKDGGHGGKGGEGKGEGRAITAARVAMANTTTRKKEAMIRNTSRRKKGTRKETVGSLKGTGTTATRKSLWRRR